MIFIFLSSYLSIRKKIKKVMKKSPLFLRKYFFKKVNLIKKCFHGIISIEAVPYPPFFFIYTY